MKHENNYFQKISNTKNKMGLFRMIHELALDCPTFFLFDLLCIFYNLEDPHEIWTDYIVITITATNRT